MSTLGNKKKLIFGEVKKTKTRKSPFFKSLVDHIDQSWVKARGYHYPFSDHDMKNLANLSRIFQEWGVMALWDVFLASEGEWVKKSGFSLSAFSKCVPWLVDNPTWKAQASSYEAKIAPPIPEPIRDLFGVLKVGEIG